jgi:3-hydroxymyristoyl/3-hydroxydecanoyl-(acyl carrier protein) dehydratase
MMQHQELPIRRSILSIVQKFKLRQPAGPGDRLLYRADLVTMREEFGVVNVRADLDGEVCAEGELIFTFVDIPDETLHASRLELYKICMKHTKVLDT